MVTEKSKMENLINGLLKRYFAEDVKTLRPGQFEVLESILSGENTLAIMPTGSGKSLCYQLPAFERGAKGKLTVVISPLIALMKDQYEKITAKGTGIDFLNSSLPGPQQLDVLRKLAKGKIQILFVAPERLRDGLFLTALARSPNVLSLCVVDEAHCISEWGHDFRVDYLYIPEFLEKNNHPQVVALTATAPPPVKKEIIHLLCINDDNVFDNFPIYRENFEIIVKNISGQEAKINFLKEFIQEVKMPGIIYTTGREKAEQLADILKKEGIKADYYHAERKATDKDKVQDGFLNNKIEVICATKAFGMGIDKPNVRFVLHWQIAGSLDAYVQEIGRAGRDDKNCQCFMLYDSSDLKIHKTYISRAYPGAAAIAKTYRETLYLGPLEYDQKNYQDIPISLFYEKEEAAIMLRHFENIAIIVRAGEIQDEIEITRVADVPIESPWASMIVALKQQIKYVPTSIDILKFARNMGLNQLDALSAIYIATVENIIDVGSRELRVVRYNKLKPDIEAADIAKIEIEMAKRKAFKLQRLMDMQKYVETRSTCRAVNFSEYFGKSMREPCGKCDICSR